MLRLTINGKSHDVDVEPDTPLLWVIRDSIGMTGTKYGCGIAQCGACTVHIDGVATRSCGIAVGDVVGKKITTIEGLEQNGKLHPVQAAFLEQEALQCGYCTSGMILSAVALLNAIPNPTDDDIVRQMNGNVCRCGTYARILAAVKQAAQQSRRS